MKKLIFLILIVGIFVSIYFVTRIFSTNYSPDILYFSPPIYNLSGKIDKISDNKIWVSQTYTYNSYNIPPEEKTTPVTKNVIFELDITPLTKFSQLPAVIPYLSPSEQNNNQKTITMSGLKIGDLITFTSSQDIRIAKNNRISVSNIQIPPITNTISGTVTSLSNDSISIKGFYSPFRMMGALYKSPAAKNYTVNISSDTNILIASTEGLKKTTLSSIKQGDNITVYSNIDVINISTIPAVVIQIGSINSTSISPASTQTTTPSSTLISPLIIKP